MRLFYACLIMFFVLHVFGGCTSAQIQCFESGTVGCPKASPSPTPTPEPGEVITVEIPEDLPKLPGMKSEWTLELFKNLLAQMPHLEKASDLARFCPNYSKLETHAKLVFWGHLASAMIRFESGFDDSGKYFKTCSSMTEANGIDSIGFFQMSYGDGYEGCPKTKAQGNLCTLAVNFKCGTSAMGALVKRYGKLAAGGYEASGAPPAEGLARYWSVLRIPDPKPRKVCDSKGVCKMVQKKHHLTEISELAKKAPGCS